MFSLREAFPFNWRKDAKHFVQFAVEMESFFPHKRINARLTDIDLACSHLIYSCGHISMFKIKQLLQASNFTACQRNKDLNCLPNCFKIIDTQRYEPNWTLQSVIQSLILEVQLVSCLVIYGGQFTRKVPQQTISKEFHGRVQVKLNKGYD